MVFRLVIIGSILLCCGSCTCIEIDADASKSSLMQVHESLYCVHDRGTLRIRRPRLGAARARPQAAMSRVESALKAAGLPPLAWYEVLVELERAGGCGLRPFALEEALLLPQYGLSRLLARMEAAGLVVRGSCPQRRPRPDRRADRRRPRHAPAHVRRSTPPRCRRRSAPGSRPAEAEGLADLLGRLIAPPAKAPAPLRVDSRGGRRATLAPGPRAAGMTADLIITNALVVTADAAGTVIRDGAVAVDGRADRPDRAGGGDRRRGAREVIDARGMLLMPGLINTHCHAGGQPVPRAGRGPAARALAADGLEGRGRDPQPRDGAARGDARLRRARCSAA